MNFKFQDDRAKELHVIVAISNPVRYKSRYKLFKDFEKRMIEAGVTLWVIEAAFHDRPFEVTDSCNPQHVQVRHRSELWLKENLQNIAVQSLPHDWKFICFADGDIAFGNPNWANETIAALQHYDIVQPFEHVVDLDDKFNIMKKHDGLIYRYFQENFNPPSDRSFKKYCHNAHPGFLLAMTRYAYDSLGGLIDYSILGAGDRNMFYALLGIVHESVPVNISPEYLKMLLAYQDRAIKYIDYNLGYIHGTVLHHFHGLKSNRKYLERWAILTQNNYDPLTDIKKNSYGVYELAGNKHRLRDEIRKYFRIRREDDTFIQP